MENEKWIEGMKDTINEYKIYSYDLLVDQLVANKKDILRISPRLIISRPKDKTVVVLFFNGDKRIMHLAKGDKYSVYVATCVAICEQIYGSNSSLTKFIDEKTKEQK